MTAKMVKTKLVPPDGGWGWVVLFSALVVNLLIPGTVKSFGVLFVEFLQVFKSSPTAASWMAALCYFLYSSLGTFFLAHEGYTCFSFIPYLMQATFLFFFFFFFFFNRVFDDSVYNYFSAIQTGPLSSVLSMKYSYRTVTLIGGTFAATGMMLSYFATSVSFLYVR